MDLFKAITALQEEKRRLDIVIENLEDLRSGRAAPSELRARGKRGRKGMNEAERAEVSERMKAYWAKKRKGIKGS